MLDSLWPLLLLLAIITGILFAVKLCISKSLRGPAEKEGIQKGILATLLTDSWLFGWLYAKNKSDYDYDKCRLKR